MQKPARPTPWGVGSVARLLVLAAAVLFPSPAPAETVLTFVTWKPNHPEVFDEAIRRFEAAHPGIRIRREVGPHSSTEFHDLLTQKLKNRDPSVDVFYVDVIWPAEFAAAGWVLPLDRFLSPQERRAFLEPALRAATYRGKIYGIPGWIDSGMLYYRKDLLAKYGFQPPKTWEELVRQAEVIVAGERSRNPGIHGYSGQFKQYEGLVCDMMEFILSNNGAILDETGRKAAIHRPEAVAAVRFVRDRIIGHIAPRGVLMYQEPESLDLFIQGNAVFHRNWPYAWEISNDPARSRVAGKVGIARLPAFEGGRSAAALGGWMLSISPFSRHPEEAWTFIRFMTSPQMQKFLAIRAGRAPARKALYRDPEVLRKNPQFRDQFQVFLTARPRPVSPVYPVLSNILQRYFSAAISNPRSDIEALARRAAWDMDRVLALAP